MAISSIRFDNIQNVTRKVDYLNADAFKQRYSVVSGEQASRESALVVLADGSASRSTTLQSENFSRQVTSNTDGQGNASRSVSVTLPSGQQITRDTSVSKTTDEKGNVTGLAVSRTVNGLSGVRTFVGDVTSTNVTGTFTYTKGDTTQTYAVDRERKQSSIEPLPVEITLPIEKMPAGEMPISLAPVDDLA